MRELNLREVIIKNFKANLTNYISCFIYNSFTVMSFFMFTTLIYNKDIEKIIANKSIDQLLKVPNFVIAIFSIIFIGYSQNMFIKRRGKEFGLYLLFGMTSAKIQSFIFIENLIIQMLSLIMGMVAGSVFSPLFFIIITRMLNFKDISIQYNIKSYILTSLIFVIIFIVVNIISVKTVSKLDIIDVLKMNKKTGVNRSKNSVWGIIGIILFVAAGVVWSYPPIDSNRSHYLIISFLLFSIGAYLILSQIGNLLTAISKMNKRLFYKNLLINTEITYRINSIKKIMFLITILIAASILFITVGLSEYMDMDNNIDTSIKYHLYYKEMFEKNTIYEDELNSILRLNGNDIEFHRELPFVIMETSLDSLGSNYVLITSAKDYNRVFNDNVHIMGNEGIRIGDKKELKENKNKSYKVKLSYLGSDLSTKKWNKSLDIILKNDIYNKDEGVHSIIKYDIYCIVLSNKAYAEIKENSNPRTQGVQHIINFHDWKKSQQVVNKFTERLQEGNNNSSLIKIFIDSSYEEEYLKPVSKSNYYSEKKNEYLITTFIFAFVGILFYFMACNILYLKYLDSREALKDKFTRLFRIGIKDYEIKILITKELKLVFFIPMILGFFIGSSYVIVTALKAPETMKLFIQSTLYPAVAFTILNIVHYYLTRYKTLKFVNEILGFLE